MSRRGFSKESVSDLFDLALRGGREKADGIEVSFEGTELDLMRFGESRIVQSGFVRRGCLTVRAVVGGVEGVAKTTKLDPSGIEHAVAQAIAGAARDGSGEAVVLPAARAIAAAPDWAMNSATLELDGPTKARWLAPALAAHRADDLALAGRFNTGLLVRAVRSTTGVDAYHAGTGCDLLLSSLERPAGHRASSSRKLVDAGIDRAQLLALGDEVREECRRAHDPIEVAPGAWDVVLGAGALASILGWFAQIGFTPRAIENGTSFAAGKVGESVTGAVTLFDDGSMPSGRGLPLPFDAEGQPRERVSLLADGVVRGQLHTSRSALRAGCASTGHAQPRSLFGSGGGARAQSLHFAAGSASLDELVGQVQRGLFVTRLHYVNGLLDPKRALMTGLLRDAAFLIEDGRITRAVQPMRFTDSMLEAFARVGGPEAIGRETRPTPPHSGFHATVVCPDLLVRGLEFTSGR